MERDSSTHTAGYKIYFYTWLALLVLAALTIAATRFPMGGAGIIIALLIASVKAALILSFFMHLRHESRFFKLSLLLPIIVFLFFIGFTFSDVLYR